MIEAPVAASLRSGELGDVRPRVSRSRRAEGRNLAVDTARLGQGPPRSLSEARRAWNSEHIGAVSELRCECAQPDCRGTVPAVAETHRGTACRFIVMPAHLNGGVVARAADQFFVVEPDGHVLPEARSELQ